MTDWRKHDKIEEMKSNSEVVENRISENSIAQVQGKNELQNLEGEIKILVQRMHDSEKEKESALEQAKIAMKEGRLEDVEKYLEKAKVADEAYVIHRTERLQKEGEKEKLKESEKQLDFDPNTPSEFHPTPAIGESAMNEQIESGAEKKDRVIFNPQAGMEHKG